MESTLYWSGPRNERSQSRHRRSSVPAAFAFILTSRRRLKKEFYRPLIFIQSATCSGQCGWSQNESSRRIVWTATCSLDFPGDSRKRRAGQASRIGTHWIAHSQGRLKLNVGEDTGDPVRAWRHSLLGDKGSAPNNAYSPVTKGSK